MTHMILSNLDVNTGSGQHGTASMPEGMKVDYIP